MDCPATGRGRPARQQWRREVGNVRRLRSQRAAAKKHGRYTVMLSSTSPPVQPYTVPQLRDYGPGPDAVARWWDDLSRLCHDPAWHHWYMTTQIPAHPRATVPTRPPLSGAERRRRRLRALVRAVIRGDLRSLAEAIAASEERIAALEAGR